MELDEAQFIEGHFVREVLVDKDHHCLIMQHIDNYFGQVNVDKPCLRFSELPIVPRYCHSLSFFP